MKNDIKNKILISALLHDIGKFIYRALEPEFQKNYRHQELGREWAKKLELSGEIITVIERHHRLRKDDKKYEKLSLDTFKGPTHISNLIKLIDFSDNTSSGMERGGGDEESGHFMVDAGLQPIFSNISLGEELTGVQPSLVWEAKNIKDRPYAVEADKELGKYSSFYKNQWKMFEEEFRTIAECLEEERLLLLLQKYTMQIPEYTRVIDGQLPDTSLYHHLKATAAIAWCSYRYITGEKLSDESEWYTKDLEKLIYNDEEERFLLVAGDLSGIQSFIYTLTSDDALKTVRGRSFYLELLMETAVQRLVEELNLCYSSVIYNSGGGFYLLAPNTKNVIETLEKEKRWINDKLYKEFGLTLYLALSFRPLNAFDLKDPEGKLQTVWGQLKEDLGKEKGQKWNYLLTEKYDELFNPQKEIRKECIICGQPVEGEGDRCLSCIKMIELGRKLAESSELYQLKKESVKNVETDIEVLDRHYSFTEPKNKNDIERVFFLKDLWKVSKDFKTKNFPVAGYVSQKEFNELAKQATGFKKLGILRMDVDRLGTIFSRGLKNKATFARLSDLSERFNLYFKYYLPRMLEERIEAPLTHNTKRRENTVNLIYSGGDDLFLVGTWDSALDVAWLIYSDFKKYTGYHSDLSLSAGYVVADEKWAFYRMADAAGDEERKAKDTGRDSISIFGRPLKWNKINVLKEERESETLKDVLFVIAQGLEFKDSRAFSKIFSKNFIRKLQQLVEMWNENKKREENYWIFPRIYYLFAREMESVRKRNNRPAISFYKQLFSMILKEPVLEELMGPALLITDYLMRGGESE
ncbi:MAG: type III-A CRISPR-associated protein Cas10/Csm1 [Caldanaerobacter subterraneus]|nr:type III-A CRISPR-associated protein Cas10/Csm1 [Caldanaerobacter subterraneus]